MDSIVVFHGSHHLDLRTTKSVSKAALEIGIAKFLNTGCLELSALCSLTVGIKNKNRVNITVLGGAKVKTTKSPHTQLTRKSSHVLISYGFCSSSLSSIETALLPVSSQSDGDTMVEHEVWASATPGPALLSFIISSTARASKGGLGSTVADESNSLLHNVICIHARRRNGSIQNLI